MISIYNGHCKPAIYLDVVFVKESFLGEKQIYFIEKAQESTAVSG